MMVTNAWFDEPQPNPLHPIGWIVDPVRRLVEVPVTDGHGPLVLAVGDELDRDGMVWRGGAYRPQGQRQVRPQPPISELSTPNTGDRLIRAARDHGVDPSGWLVAAMVSALDRTELSFDVAETILIDVALDVQAILGGSVTGPAVYEHAREWGLAEIAYKVAHAASEPSALEVWRD